MWRSKIGSLGLLALLCASCGGGVSSAGSTSTGGTGSTGNGSGGGGDAGGSSSSTDAGSGGWGGSSTSGAVTGDSEDASTDGAGETMAPESCEGSCVEIPDGWQGPIAVAIDSGPVECQGSFDMLFGHAYRGLSAPEAACECACGAAAGMGCSSIGTTAEFATSDSNACPMPYQHIGGQACTSIFTGAGPGGRLAVEVDPGFQPAGLCPPMPSEVIEEPAWAVKRNEVGNPREARVGRGRGECPAERARVVLKAWGRSAAGGVAMMTAGLSMDRPASEVIASGVSLAVAAVPEGLPLLATLAQLAAARRLSQRGALVRNPRAVEALGRADILCADKTGTLTEGKIQLRFVSDGVREAPVEDLSEDLCAVLRAALRAGPSGQSDALPHATDRALVEGAHAAGLHRREDADGFVLLHELPFEPARGYHAVLGHKGGAHHVSIKGAPETVLPRCVRHRCEGHDIPLDAAAREALEESAMRLAGRGLRVLAVAERTIPARDHIADRHVVELTFLGWVAFADPVRPTAKRAVDAIRRGGVDVVMITGDHPTTAEAIARELGLPTEDAVMTGGELDALDEAALDARIEHTSVFARVTPSQKVRIVRSL